MYLNQEHFSSPITMKSSKKKYAFTRNSPSFCRLWHFKQLTNYLKKIDNGITGWLVVSSFFQKLHINLTDTWVGWPCQPKFQALWGIILISLLVFPLCSDIAVSHFIGGPCGNRWSDLPNELWNVGTTWQLKDPNFTHIYYLLGPSLSV